MSELKATRIKMVYNGEVYDDFGTVPCSQLYFRKEEADKVIAELKEKLDIYKRGWAENDKIIAYLCAELRLQKYKRCLAMARLCATKRDLYKLMPRFAKMAFYMKWRKRWLELAEKLKEADK